MLALYILARVALLLNGQGGRDQFAFTLAHEQVSQFANTFDRGSPLRMLYAHMAGGTGAYEDRKSERGQWRVKAAAIWNNPISDTVGDPSTPHFFLHVPALFSFKLSLQTALVKQWQKRTTQHTHTHKRTRTLIRYKHAAC